RTVDPEVAGSSPVCVAQAEKKTLCEKSQRVFFVFTFYKRLVFQHVAHNMSIEVSVGRRRACAVQSFSRS
ncbi:MAG: hypothetical protein P8J27_16425, partial [Mariniblastus sp.]|nr:hypothetical protein [Mariniblastus sp.]